MNHFVLDAFNGYRSRLDDILLVQEILEEIPEKLGVKAVMPPFYCRTTMVLCRRTVGLVPLCSWPAVTLPFTPFPSERYISWIFLRRSPLTPNGWRTC